MPTAVVPLAPGFEELEAVAIIDVLRRAGVEVRVSALEGGPEARKLEVEGSHGIAIRADGLLADVDAASVDAVVLPGGQPGSSNLRESEDLRGLLLKVRDQGGLIAAVCAAPTVLAAAGLLEGRKFTCYPGYEPLIAGAHHRGDPVVTDGRLITSRGPGTALQFALTVAAALQGEDVARDLQRKMLVKELDLAEEE